MESSQKGLTEGPTALQAGEVIRAALDADPGAPEQIRAARDRLLERVAAAEPRRGERLDHWLGFGLAPSPRRLRFGLALVAVVLAGAAAGTIWMRAPISFRVAGTTTAGAGVGRLGDVVQTSGAEPVTLSFSEGSSIVLSDGGRVRVLSAEPTGARVLLERGGADVAIVHRRARGTHWRFEAGPFRLLVTGTRFHVAWNPSDESFAVETGEGSVSVSGPCLTAASAVRAGERARFSCASKREPPEIEPLLALAPTTAPAAGSPAEGRATVGAGRWRGLVAAGHFAEALRDAERAGFEHVCRIASHEELLALADAARLSQHTARAITALVTLRQRFAGSADAATAAFTLGRIAFEKRAAYADAERWFATYLDEQPAGPLMGDAAGRLMEAAERAGARSRARGYAQRYLARFPEGPYAAKARALVGGD